MTGHGTLFVRVHPIGRPHFFIRLWWALVGIRPWRALVAPTEKELHHLCQYLYRTKHGRDIDTFIKTHPLKHFWPTPSNWHVTWFQQKWLTWKRKLEIKLGIFWVLGKTGVPVIVVMSGSVLGAVSKGRNEWSNTDRWFHLCFIIKYLSLYFQIYFLAMIEPKSQSLEWKENSLWWSSLTIGIFHATNWNLH